MLDRTSVIKISERLRLSPYQSRILEKNGHAYDLDRLVKKGVVLYAPYKSEHGFADFMLGPRADLIGEGNVLVCAQRGIKLYATGFYRAHDMHGHAYYADSAVTAVDKSLMFRIMG